MRRIDAIYQQLNLTEEQRMLQEMTRDFAAGELAPHVVEWEREQRHLPDSFLAQMADLGLFGIMIPEEYGGTGGGIRELILAGMELGYQSPSAGITLGAAISLGAKPILLSGNDEQRQRWLPALAAGTSMGCFGLTEPNVGSDAANPDCRATQDPSTGDWLIRGSKHFTTNREWSSVCICHALTDPDARPYHRTTCFLVPMDAPGLEHWDMPGKTGWMLSSTGFLSFDDCRVPNEGLLGERGEGFLVMMKTLDGGRLFVGALGLASVAACLDHCIKYARERQQFGRRIGDYQRIQDILVEMEEALQYGLVWLWHAATRYDQGEVDRHQSALVKRVLTEDAVRCCSRAMQLFGGASYIDESLIFYHHRDSRVVTIGEGANEVLSSVAARYLLDKA
jgi:alkylation response protein AidB-like acyl-CoA dehydrogenase